MSGIKIAKHTLRQEIDKKLCKMSKIEQNKQSKTVTEKLFNMVAYKNAKQMCVYLSNEKEINTEPIVKQIFEDGKKCYVPRSVFNKERCNKGGLMEMVELHSMKDWASLPFTKWNIRQPSFDDKRANALSTGLDLMIVPGVAFTKEGRRLGHGVGYYDRYLNTFFQKRSEPITLLGIAFNEQIVDELPIEETDYKVDMVLYANKI